MGLKELVHGLRAEPEPIPAVAPPPTAGPGVHAKIAAAMAREPETFEVTIAAGDAVAVVEFTEIRGQVWEDVTAHCPPRDGYPSDATHGFNPVATPAHYPVSAIRIDGESVDGATWAELVSLLDAPALEDMGTALWAVHYWQPRQKLARLLAERKEKA